MVKLFITMDTITDKEDIIHLLSCILEKIKNTSPNKIDKVMFRADILEDLDYDRLSGHYTDEVVDEVLNYTFDFIEQKEKQNEISINLNEYRLSFNSLNRIVIILNFLIGEERI